MKTGCMLLVVITMLCSAAYASEAPWYKWINLTDRTILCAQTSPGATWARYRGPYTESRCNKPGYPR